MLEIGQLDRSRSIGIRQPDLLVTAPRGGKRQPSAVIGISGITLAAGRRSKFHSRPCGSALRGILPNRILANGIREDERSVASRALCQSGTFGSDGGSGNRSMINAWLSGLQPGRLNMLLLRRARAGPPSGEINSSVYPVRSLCR